MENARLFFTVKEGEDALEKYEELLFEDKKFFTQKPIVEVLFRKRLAKMDMRQQAFDSLYSHHFADLKTIDIVFEADEKDVMRHYLNFQEVRKVLFNRFYQAESIPELNTYVQFLLDIYKRYLKPWSKMQVKKTDLITLAKESDPSLLFSAIKSFHLAGGKNVNDLQNVNFAEKTVLVHEAKRLSLLYQKMQD
jgi:hypothetical protein